MNPWDYREPVCRIEHQGVRSRPFESKLSKMSLGTDDQLSHQRRSEGPLLTLFNGWYRSSFPNRLPEAVGCANLTSFVTVLGRSR